jgi:hypothetical protein
MKRASLLLLAPLLLSSCMFIKGSSGKGGAEELTAIAGKVKETTYAAGYKFGFTGPLAPAVRTRMEIVQDPPNSLRRLDTTTPVKEGKPATVTSWYVHNMKGNFACDDYAQRGVRCIADPVANGTFGTQNLDQFFDTPREANAFASVRKSGRPIRIHGERATCFEAVPAAPSPVPVTSPQPQITPERFRYELCYADDGILLRGRRTILEEGGTGEREAVVEVTSISRVVEAQELKLPGPVANPEDLTP